MQSERDRHNHTRAGAAPAPRPTPGQPSRATSPWQNPWVTSGVALACVLALFTGALLPKLSAHVDLGTSGRPEPKLWKANPADKLDHGSVLVPGPVDAATAARIRTTPGLARLDLLSSGPAVAVARPGIDTTAFRAGVERNAERRVSHAERYVGPAEFKTGGPARKTSGPVPPGAHAADVYSTNDPFYPYQWGLYNAGSSLGDGAPSTPRADVHAPEAWANATGTGVTVAVVDSGVEVDHPDLAPNIWNNPGETCGASTDADGNGYAGDCHGWNFADNNADVNDDGPDAGHGTHLAGTIAAATGNGIGIAGVAPNAKLMVLKVGHGRLLSVPAILAAITYAADNGAKVIATAFGDLEYARRPGTDAELLAWRQAIDYAGSKGAVVVAAAGNDRADIDRSEHLPATAARPNVIVVGATDRDDNPTSFTNRGQIVDLVAPGEAIFSTWPGHTYRMANGTSTAVPFVAGTLALVFSQRPTLTPVQAIARLNDTAYGKASLRDISRTGARVDANAATDTAALPDSVSFRGFHRTPPGTPVVSHIHVDAATAPPAPTWHLTFAAACHGAVCGVANMPVRITDPDGTIHDEITDTSGAVSRLVATGASLDIDVTYQLPVGQYALMASVIGSDSREIAGVVYFGVDSRTQSWAAGIRPVAPSTTTTSTTLPATSTTTTQAGTSTTTTTSAGTSSTTTTTTAASTTTTTTAPSTTTTIAPTSTTRPTGDLPPPPGGNNPDPNTPGTTTTTTATTTTAPSGGTSTTTATTTTTTAPSLTTTSLPNPSRPSPMHPTANFQIWDVPATAAPGDIVTIRGGRLPSKVAVSFEHDGVISYSQILIAQADKVTLIVPSHTATVTDIVVTDKLNPNTVDRIPDTFTYLPARTTTTTTAPAGATTTSTTTTLPSGGTTTTTSAGGGGTTTAPSFGTTTTTSASSPSTTAPPAPGVSIPPAGTTIDIGGGLTGIVLPSTHRLAATAPGAWAPMACVASVCRGGHI